MPETKNLAMKKLRTSLIYLSYLKTYAIRFDLTHLYTSNQSHPKKIFLNKFKIMDANHVSDLQARMIERPLALHIHRTNPSMIIIIVGFYTARDTLGHDVFMTSAIRLTKDIANNIIGGKLFNVPFSTMHSMFVPTQIEFFVYDFIELLHNCLVHHCHRQAADPTWMFDPLKVKLGETAAAKLDAILASFALPGDKVDQICFIKSFLTGPLAPLVSFPQSALILESLMDDLAKERMLHNKARTIQHAWRFANSCPHMQICKRRLEREFHELSLEQADF